MSARSYTPGRDFGAIGLLKICFFRGAGRFAPGTPEKTLIYESEKCTAAAISFRVLFRANAVSDSAICPRRYAGAEG